MQRNILRALLLIFLAGALFAGWNFYQEMKPDLASEKWYENARQTGFGDRDGQTGAFQAETAQGAEGPDFEALRSAYPDICAWIFSPGTVLDYPVVQAEDNDYYLEHLPDGTANRNGSVFMDWRNRGDFSDRLTAVYGHHIRGGRMFSVLDGYKEQAYYEEHPFLYLYTPEGSFRLELLAGAVLDGAGGDIPVDGSAEEQTAWLEALAARSTFRPNGGRSGRGAGLALPETALAGAAAPETVLPEPAPPETDMPESFPKDEDGFEDMLGDAAGRYVVLCTCSYEYSNAHYAVVGRLCQ